VKLAPHGYEETVKGRIKLDRKFARGLYAEAINAILEGETATSCAPHFARIISLLTQTKTSPPLKLAIPQR
jgi:hypothetical protein